ANVRQLVVADGGPLRDAAAPQGRERGLAARRHRAAAGEAGSRSEPDYGRDRARRVGLALALDERQAEGLQLERQAALRPHLVLGLLGRAARHPVRDEAEGRAASTSASAPEEEEPTAPATSSRIAASRRPERLGLGFGDRLRQPGGDARRLVVA